MTFDPMKFYDDSKRRESRWGAVTPFILVGLLLLVMGVAGYFGYRGARPKHTLGSPAVIPYTKLKAGPATGGVCVYRQGEGWICGDPALSHPELSHAFHVTRPRKHKRKTDGHLVWYDFKFTPSPNQPYESWRFINTIPAELSCTKRTKTSGIHCESRPLTPAEIEQYKPMTEKPQPSDEGVKLEREKASAYDELVLDHDQVFYDDVFVPGGSCTDRERYRELQCVSGGKCKLRNKDANWCLDASVDGDVQRTKIVPDCLYGGSVDGSIRPCTADDNLTIHLNPSKPIPSWILAPSTPTCVMPADIDVCPIQMLDRREATSGVQPVIANEEAGYSDAARASVFAAMLTCAVDPKASPEIILKAGPTIVPCATLKWAEDAVDADKKKGISRTFDTFDWNYEWHSHD